MSTAAHQARETIKQEKKNGTLINASGKKPTKTAVFLDNGTVIASPLSVARILSAIERSNIKQINTQANATKRLTVYDVADEEPDEEYDQENYDVSVDDE